MVSDSFATLLTVAHQAPLSMGFSRQEQWSGLPFPSPMPESEKWKWSRSVSVRLFVTPWTTAHQAPPSMGFSRQEYWSGVPSPFPTEQIKIDSHIHTSLIPVLKFQNPTAYSGFWFVQNPITWLLAGVSDNYCFSKNQYFLRALKCTRQNKGKELDHSSSSLKQNKASR